MCTAKYSSKEISPMALPESAVSELLEAFRTGDGLDLVKESVRGRDAGADRRRGDRALRRRPLRTHRGPRATERNGARATADHHPGRRRRAGGSPSCALGRLVLPVSILVPRRRIDQALYAVMMEAYVHGVSTRRVDDLVVALGGDRDLQVRGVEDLRRPGRGRRGVPHPPPWTTPPSRTCTWTRPTCTCAPSTRMVVSKAVVVATGVTARRPPRGPRPGRRRQRGRGVLAGLPDRAQEARPDRGAAW